MEQNERPAAREFAADMCGLAAWLVLLAGVAGAVVQWVFFSAYMPPDAVGTMARTEVSGWGVALGVAYLVSGAIGFFALRTLVAVHRHVTWLTARLKRS